MNAPSLKGFFDMTDANYQLFDLGVQVRMLPPNSLAAIDQGEKYPHPHLGYAWLAILVWNDERIEQNSLWFLKLPLDEMGIVSAPAHNGLVRRLYQALQNTNEKERQRLLTEHPFQFKPDAVKMAALHARATQLLNLPASMYFDDAKDYYLNESTPLSWQNIGLQGIADLVARLTDDKIDSLNRRIETLDQEPLIGLAQQLTHQHITASTAKALIDRASRSSQTGLQNLCLQACSQAETMKDIEPYIFAKLNTLSGNLEFLLILVTHYTALLSTTRTAVLILDQLAKHTDSSGFNRVVTNLAMQPDLEGIVMKVFRSDQLTETLATALSQLIQNQRGHHEELR